MCGPTGSYRGNSGPKSWPQQDRTHHRIGKVEHQPVPGEPGDRHRLVNNIGSERVKPMLHRVNVHGICGLSGIRHAWPRPFLQPSFGSNASTSSAVWIG